LGQLIAAIYTPGTALTIDQILRIPNNDAIVTLASQLAGVQADHFKTFRGLSHTGALDASLLSGFRMSNANILDCGDVNSLVACWLSRSGNNGCLAGVRDLPACYTPVRASETVPANKNAVPMPHIVVAHPRTVDRLTLPPIPSGLALGTPFELGVNTGSGDLPEIQVTQSDETSKHKSLTATISRVAGRTVYLSVTPELFGGTKLQVSANYRDGGIASKKGRRHRNLTAWAAGDVPRS
jgi:hypothetical protein